MATIVSADALGRVEFGGDGSQHLDVDIGVLVFAEVVLQRLESFHEPLASASGSRLPKHSRR